LPANWQRGAPQSVFALPLQQIRKVPTCRRVDVGLKRPDKSAGAEVCTIDKNFMSMASLIKFTTFNKLLYNLGDFGLLSFELKTGDYE
jgi:hypothetical protein